MRMSVLAAAAVIGCALSVSAAKPPDPADPSTWGDPMPLPADVAPARELKLLDIAERTAAREAERAARPVTTQRMARVKGEMLARIETDPDTGRKIAVVLKGDDTVERRPVRVLATARVKPVEAPTSKGIPRSAENAAAAAAGAVAGAAAAATAAAIKKRGKQ